LRWSRPSGWRYSGSCGHAKFQEIGPTLCREGGECQEVARLGPPPDHRTPCCAPRRSARPLQPSKHDEAHVVSLDPAPLRNGGPSV
jgi:hypothetical protein